MPSIEDFMTGLFGEKIELEKQRLARVAPFRQKYFTPDSNYALRPGLLEQFQSEKIKSIEISGSEAQVITTQIAFNVHSEASFEMRYLLRAEGERWLIYEVDIRCCCSGESPKADCPSCHGTGWRNTDVKKRG